MRILLLSIAIIISLSTSFSIAASADAEMEAQSSDSIPNSDIKRFVTSIAVIRHYYINKVSDTKLFNDAISGMVRSLDPHSTFMDKNALKSLSIATNGKFSGVGIELTESNGLLKVISPIDDSPAANAGIKPEDLIIAINGQLVRDMSLDDAVKQIRGEKGTDVKLTVLRKDSEKALHFVLKRNTIKLQAVKSKMIAPGYAYIRLALFQGNANKQLRKALKKAQQESKGKLSGVVLDLRNNPGGLLDVGTSVANTFLDAKSINKQYKDLIVYTKGRAQDSRMQIRASGKDMIDGVPMVVLINSGSASASEIVAGALQDYNRAIIMGTRSFGKGSVQTILPIGNDEAVKLTTALYFTPAGREIQAKGITPDVTVKQMSVQKPSAANMHIYEANLQDHLLNKSTTSGKNKTEETDLAQKDYQLYAALNMLRGIHALNR
jgi:carboxyl-terminal processing protease